MLDYLRDEGCLSTCPQCVFDTLSTWMNCGNFFDFSNSNLNFDISIRFSYAIYQHNLINFQS